MTDERQRLVHDVAKYLARTARNLPAAGPIPGPLVPLLVRDAYGREGEARASEVFARLAGDALDPELAECREELAAIDALEGAARAGDDAALREVARRALRVAEVLGEWASS
jgi:hypothetical protein